jgi:DNA-directed RNA polymerase specialized sigma subunit
MDSVIEHRFALAQVAFKTKIRTYARNAIGGANQGSAAGIWLNMEQEDIEQELLMVLLKAVERYDPNNGSTFNTFAQRCFQNRLVSLGREQAADKRKASSSVEWLDDEAVALAVERKRASASAEDEVMANFDVSETLRMLRDRASDQGQEGKVVNRRSRLKHAS